MNRLSSLITAGLTTGLSAAALGATAMAQGVFGGGDTAPDDSAAVQQVAEATTEATAAVAATATESPTPRIVYVDKEPIVVTRQVQVPGSSAPASQEGAGGAGAGGGVTDSSTPAPPPVAAPTQARSATPEAGASSTPPANPSPALVGTGGVSTAGAFDDNGGATPRDNRVESGDDRRSDDEDQDDDEQDDEDQDDEDREDDGDGDDD